MTHDSPPDLLVLHAVRVIGFADTPTIARRVNLDPGGTGATLRDAERHGRVVYTTFAGTGGWSLTGPGRTENERQLATELDLAGGADEVRAVYRDFLPLNSLLRQACTDWQLRPAPRDHLAVNDHSDHAWDAGVLHELASIARALRGIEDRLRNVLTRFRGYNTRFAAALTHAHAGATAWIDRTDIDSCHRVWFELHEDLLATLGLGRSTEHDDLA